MIKKEFIARYSKKIDETQKKSKEYVEDFFEVLGDCLIEEEVLKFVGWGAFELKETPARRVKHPITKEDVMISAKKVIKFRVGKRIADLVQIVTEKEKKSYLKTVVSKISKFFPQSR